MTENCTNCIPIRLRNAKSEPLTPIVWAHQDFETIEAFTVPSKKKDGTLFDAKLNVLKRTRKLVGDILIWEINITPHDPKPKSLLGQLRFRWENGLTERRAHPVQWFLIGIALAMIVTALGWVAWEGLAKLVSSPLASMVWIWVKLGVWLPLVALFVAVYFVASVARTDRPFNFGFVVMFAAVGPLVALLIANDLFDLISASDCAARTDCFPVLYDDAGRKLLQGFIDTTAAFYDEVAFIWTPLTLLLNGAGLAGLVAIIDKLGGWAVALKESEEPEGDNEAILEAQSNRAARIQQENFALAQARSQQQSQEPIWQRQNITHQFVLRLPLTPLEEEQINDDILEPPAHC